MLKKKLTDLQITELLLVKAGNDWTRTFMATIKREIDIDGNPVVCGVVDVEGWRIWSIASTEEELGENLDAICDLILNSDMSSLTGVMTYSDRMEIRYN